MHHRPLYILRLYSANVNRERALADLGSQLVTKSGKKATAEALGKATLIGLYFSAHWVSPRCTFTASDIFLTGLLLYQYCIFIPVPSVSPVHAYASRPLR
jgi:hypothetical protein